jgi:Phage integrase, N-terminal SAM-like domain
VIDRDEGDRDLASLTVARVGALVETGEVWEPWQLLDPAGEVVAPVATWLRDLQAAGRSALTQRSYGMDLLRWFRFLWAMGVCWNHATRTEARDFTRWAQITDKPRSPRLVAGGSNPVTGKTSPGTKYASSTRGHSESVLRGFYEFHREAGSGPMINPFPLVRRNVRRHAHHNPMEPYRNERTGLDRKPTWRSSSEPSTARPRQQQPRVATRPSDQLLAFLEAL